jgi:hypothetical protein
VVRSREPLWNPGEREEILAVTMAIPDRGAPHAQPVLLAHPPGGLAITLAWALVMTGHLVGHRAGVIPVFFCTLMWAFEPAFPEGH